MKEKLFYILAATAIALSATQAGNGGSGGADGPCPAATCTWQVVYYDNNGQQQTDTVRITCSQDKSKSAAGTSHATDGYCGSCTYQGETLSCGGIAPGAKLTE